MAKPQPTQLDWLSQLLSWITYRAASAPERTLLWAALITCGAIGLAAFRLEFRTSRLDLLSPTASYNQRWLAYLDQFGREDDAVVVVSHSDPKLVSQALDSLGQRLLADSRLHGVMYRQSLGSVADKSLSLMPTAQLEQLHQLISGCLQSLGGTYIVPASAAGGATQAANLARPASLQQHLATALTGAQLGLDRLKQSIPRDGPLLLEDQGRLGLCLLRVPHLDDEPVSASEQIQTVQAHLAAMRPIFPEVQFGLTGMPVLEWDEGQSTQKDMQKATLLSLAGVAAMLVFGFGSWRMPCAAVACLAIGLTWTLGLATLIVGHLNLFSVAFGAIIAGLGIDYAIHLLARLQTQHRERDGSGHNRANHGQLDHGQLELSADTLPASLAQAVAHCGTGIFTGAVTTAAAFAVSVLTPFRGMTELGMICAAGTVACMAVTIWILPAVLVIQARWTPKRRGANPSVTTWLATLQDRVMEWLDWINQSNLRWRVPILLSTLCVTSMSALQLDRLKYDHNLLNLQAENAPSVLAEQELTAHSQHSAWCAISLTNSAPAAQALRTRLEQLPSVARVEEVGSLMAASQNSRQQELVAACRTGAAQLVEKITAITAKDLAIGSQPSNSLMVLPANYTAASTLDPQIVSQLQLLSRTIIEMAAPAPLSPDDLPEPVRTRMVSPDGQNYLLRIYAREDLWQRDNLAQFVTELESIDPRVTGHPIQTWYASRELENSYYQAGIYALLAVIALLVIDFGSLRLVALALIPVAISAIQLAGWLVALRIPFNAANMIVLPLIIGIGIDDGVHIMHDFVGRGPRAFRLTSSTTLAVLLTSLTTMVGFGSMAIADHRGLNSLGVVLLIGVGLCLWHSWFTLPALLSLVGPRLVGPRPAGPTLSQPHRIELASIPDQARAQSIPQLESIPQLLDGGPTPGASKPLLLRDIPVVFSLPDYPELRRSLKTQMHE